MRGTSIRFLGGRGLSYAGPMAVITNLSGWVVVMWLGYALVYLPSIERFSYDPATPFAGKGFAEALYLSGAAITTAGFGDVVATGPLLRLVTVTEAAAGFGVLSAAIAFVLALYPLTTQLRSTGLQLADVGALVPEGAARYVRDVSAAEVGTIIRQLIETHENVRRFPVLYYFESGNREESLTAMVRGSALLVVALRCGPSSEVGPAAVYADALESTLVRLLDDLERDFVGGRRRGGADRDARTDLDQRLATLCQKLSEGEAAEEPPAGLADLLTRSDAVLAAVAHEHGHDPKPILPD